MCLVSCLSSTHGAVRHGDLRELLLLLGQEVLVDVRHDTTTSNRGSDQDIQFLITSDREMEMTGSDTLDLELLRGVSSQLQNFGTQVFHDRSTVHRSSRTDTVVSLGTLLKI